MIILVGVVFSMLTTYGLPAVPQMSMAQALPAAQSVPARTLAESRYIRLNYGVWFAPKKTSRKESLALALSNMVETGQ